MGAAGCFLRRKPLRDIVVDFMPQMGVEFLRQFGIVIASAKES